MTDPGDAGWPRGRPGWPLAATLGLHLLLAWSWRIASPPAQDRFEERVFNVMPVPPPAPEFPSPPRPAEPIGTKAARTRSPAQPDVVREAEPITPGTATPPAADPFAITAPAAPAESPHDAMVGRARREAGVIDRELRKGKPGVPAVADTPWGRFARALEAAKVDTSRTLVSESYTAPDGAIVYRFRQGGRVLCRITGGVKPGIGNAIGPSAFDVQGGNGTAGLIDCPSNATWKRD